MPEIRPFRRSDRDQLTALVNAHIEAVLPGVGHAADRLRFAGVRRVLDHAVLAPAGEVADGLLPFLERVGFRELTRTRRDWRRQG